MGIRFRTPLLVTLAATAAGAICACSRAPQPTPPAVARHFHALVDSLDDERPGTSAAALNRFLDEADHYQIADSVRAHVRHFELLAYGRYHEARVMAREGEFDRAEALLEDLALLDTEDGRSARTHLEFEFYMEKARWLLVRQRFDEASEVARTLLDHNLNRFQRDQAEQVLDYTGNVGAAMDMAKGTEERSACKQLTVFLESMFVDNGYYPKTFTLEDMQQMNPYSAQTMARVFSSFEDYHADQNHYSMVVVARSGHRYHIADGQIAN